MRSSTGIVFLMNLSLCIALGMISVLLPATQAYAVDNTQRVVIQKTEYGGWPNCVKMTNGKIELVATTDVGPRIIRFGFVGGDNEFLENQDQLGKTGGDEWRSYGGHRLWHGPEARPRSYCPDNSPVKYEINGNTLTLLANPEELTGIQKEMRVTMDPEGNHVRVDHILTNHSIWPVELCPWGLTVMNKGGKVIIPQEAYSPHPGIPDNPGQVIDQRYYLPVRNMILWSYTKLNDPRWVFTSKYIILKQDKNLNRPQKIGVSNEQNWAAYARNGHLFVKKAIYQPQAKYPDNGCSMETFTISEMTELETLGPMTRLEPKASVTHAEDWYLFDSVKFEDTDESIDANVLPKVKTIL